MKLINIGFGNMVSANRLVAIVSPESAPIKRIIQDTGPGAPSSTPPMAEQPGSDYHRLRPCHPLGGAAGDGGKPLGG